MSQESDSARASEPGGSGGYPTGSFVIEQTLKGLDRQADVLDQLRSRTNIVLSAIGIIASVLASQALQGNYSIAMAVVALCSSAAGICLCIAVLWPVHDSGRLPEPTERLPRWNRWPTRRASRRREWQVTIRRQDLDAMEPEADLAPDVVKRLGLARRANYLTLSRRSNLFAWACVLLGVQLVLWTAVLLTEPRSAGPSAKVVADGHVVTVLVGGERTSP
jgi:hypothetical protein